MTFIAKTAKSSKIWPQAAPTIRTNNFPKFFVQNFNMFRPMVLLWGLYFALTPYLSAAMTDEQKAKIHEEFHTLGVECIKDHVISEDDITNLKAQKIPTGDKAPCFMACMMKKAGIMSDDGMLQNEKALEHAKKIFENEEELKKIEEYLHSCSHVNSESVSDGGKGCERALLAYKCMTENASQFGFEM